MNRDASYIGKTAYHGEVAANYDRDRVNEPVWQREQAWVEMWSQRVPAGAVVLDVPGARGRYVKVVAQTYGQIPSDAPGAGEGSWLFLDEIVVE